MKIILGSQSKGRKKILEEMGYDFEVIPPNIDEKSIRMDDPVKLTLALAHAKADAVIPKIAEDAILITSDQVVVWRGKIREKPENEKEAREFLTSYTRYPAETVTAVVVINTSNGKRVEGVDIARVWFKPIPEELVQKYLATGDVFHQAGGFSTIHPLLENYVERIEGAPDSVIGLPKELTRRLIKECVA
ncbi:MAG: septum formation protein Maf [Candidatus Sungbacteria bacterium RIFCSPLOWO2_12_FULL_41_11]|uniref:Nucleoside triphosphate pyrophosphatase n=1 Tax=Candidatus Sungbacteria bacterium RIFCSPLOWO2_12_FULL_41_11 TaxID=1802286 RepID=A0A1G2LQ22_9BACT|nr:MAG: Maf family protein [Parcubacteria group bacterium GW2011_GWA2_42_14]OGZ99896.1 MAG: septum formation protein Maf [Candidatus Sungbacteria bacterium RIFCSPHIGHO2_02_FULL_41_12b]OHA13624.1 MAG: septum formation protein Maf [Candidatus Sungbacteria bacterium RIFCSPLOWO2_12_FULL_41_11]